MTFGDPAWLLALALPAAMLWAARRAGGPSLRFPSREGLAALAAQSRAGWLKVPLACRIAALALIVAALARPRQGLESSRLKAEGIDIALAVDVSTSMLAEDFELHGKRRNRLEVVKGVVKEFILHRPNDRIGLVVFAGRPYTQAPLTLDHGWLLDRLDGVSISMLEDGTAIGSGIATGLNRLRGSKAKSRVLILLTDGVNNAGALTPDAAAQLAKALQVKIYAIGAGTKGMAPYPAKDPFGRTVYQLVKIAVDDDTLTRIAETTGGRYFRATDTESLKRTYDQIDRMETTPIEQPVALVYREGYAWFAIPAIVFLCLELALSQTRLRVLP